MRDGVEVNATNMTAEWLEFEQTLPRMIMPPAQTLAAALLRPRTRELYWSTSDGHMFLGTLRANFTPDTHDGVSLSSVGVDGLTLLKEGNESGTEDSPWKVGFASNWDRRTLIYHDARSTPRTIDLDTLDEDDALHYFNQSHERGRFRIALPDTYGGAPQQHPDSWLDSDSQLAVDWRREVMVWCQRSHQRIMYAQLRADFPVLVLVNYTLCSGLALDVLEGDVYWTSASGHLVFRASYARFNTSAAFDEPSRPVYVLPNPAHSVDMHNNESVVTAVSADGLAGDFGKDPLSPPLLLSAVGSDPDNGDAAFGSGDRLTLQFDRPTNASTEIIEDGVQPKMYVDSLFTVSEPLGSLYDGQWLDASTFRIDVHNAWLPQPQINGTFTTRVWLIGSAPLNSADQSQPVAPVTIFTANRLTGSLGTHQKPVLVSVVGSDPDNGDSQYSNGDVITFTFNMATHIGRQGVTGSTDPYRPSDEGGGAITLTKEGVDALFEFDFYSLADSESRVPSFGLDYTGRWTDDSTFVMTITNAIRQIGRDSRGRIWSRMPRLTDESYTAAGTYQSPDAIWVRVLGDVRSLGLQVRNLPIHIPLSMAFSHRRWRALLQSPRCTDRVPLTGTWGSRNQAPTILRIYGTDPDNGDTIPSPGDTLTVVFDRRTSRGRSARPPPPEPRTKAYADFFLRFDPIIGDDYYADVGPPLPTAPANPPVA